MSAAARAQHYDQQDGADQPTYVLLEGSPLPAKTIQLYQKGKHVMAEPGFLDLRSDVTFEAGSREAILESWQSAVEEQSINVRYQAEVIKVEKHTSAFELTLADSTSIHAEKVVLAIGVAGNPRKLGVPGENLPLVEYQLDDPKAHTDEVIIVIGAGDAAIENALALAKQNTVHIINRRDEFSRAKDGNLNAVLIAISDPSVNFSCFYGTTVKEVIETPDSDTPITIVLETPAGEEVILCHRVIARLGGTPRLISTSLIFTG